MSRNARIGENGGNGALLPKLPNCKQTFKSDGKGALWKVAMLAKMVYLAKMAELAALYLNLLLSSSVIMRFIRIKR